MAKLQASIELQVSEVQGEVDQLLSEISAGVRDQAHFDALEERACEIGAKLRGCFRVNVRPA